MKAKRYSQILGLVEQVKPRSIIEIGVWNGQRAIEMSRAALAHSDAVTYSGYDLFEEASPETNESELNAKPNCTLEQVKQRLFRFQDQNQGFTFTLVPGDTNKTIGGKCLAADFVYIDGGHSVATIRNDYLAVSRNPMIVFDDYYIMDFDGLGTDITKFGANVVVDKLLIDDNGLDVEILESSDPLIGGGIVALAVVRMNVAEG